MDIAGLIRGDEGTMAGRVTFQFDDNLDYQLKAVQSAVQLFRGDRKSVV